MADHYDVFVSFKNLDSQGRPTRDSELARLVFDHLTSEGLSVFFSNVALERAGEAAFKKAIDDALDRSETLVAVGTSKQNLESRWVRYEWDSFFTDMLSGLNPDSRMFTYVENLDIRSLPRALRQSQTIEHGEGSLDRLYRFIANGLKGAKKEVKRPVVGRSALMQSLAETAGEVLPKLSWPPNSNLVGTLGPIGTLKSSSAKRPSVADIEADPSMSRQDKDFLKLMWEVAELDKQREEIMSRIVALDPLNGAERDRLLKQSELLSQQRNAKFGEAQKILDLQNQSLKDIFK